MGFFSRNRPKPKDAESDRMVEELRASLAKAQEEIAFLRSQNDRLSQEAAPALKENAVLRYELFKCQTDRQVLEFHLFGLRAELGGALALLARLAPGEPPKEQAVLQAFLDLMEVGRRLGVEVRELYEAETLAKRSLDGPQGFDPERFLRLRLVGILVAVERILGEEIRRAERPGEALAGFPEHLQELRQLLAKALSSWAGAN